MTRTSMLPSPGGRTPDAAAIRAIVRAGLAAPSGDNCQPWRFHWDGAHLAILFDAGRAASFYDVHDVTSWISLGAVLLNMRLSAQARGFMLSTTLFPPDAARDVVAWCQLRQGSHASDSLLDVIETRCVNRRPYAAVRVPGPVRDALCALATPPARLSWVEDEPSKRELAALAAANDRFLFEQGELHRGLFRWIRWSRAETERTRDGLPIESLELPPWERPGFRLLASWPIVRALAALRLTRLLPVRSRRIYEQSGAIALVSVAGHDREAFVLGGQVVQHIWLTATREGLALQPITGITCLFLRLTLARGEGLSDAHRRALERLEASFARLLPEAAGETPIMLFRVGVAPPPSGRAPRRAVEEILAEVPPISARTPAAP